MSRNVSMSRAHWPFQILPSNPLGKTFSSSCDGSQDNVFDSKPNHNEMKGQMKLKRETAVAFLVSLGFSITGEWSDDKIVDRLSKVPDKVRVDDLEEEWIELFEELVKAEGEVEIVEGGAKPVAKTAGGEVDLNELDKRGLMVIIEEEDLDIPGAKKMGTAELVKRITRLRAAKPAPVKSAPPTKAPAVKEAKATVVKDVKASVKPAKAPAKAPVVKKEKTVRDKMGCKEGSISAAINARVTREWKDELDIIKEAGVSKGQARGRLYYGADTGAFEYRRLIQYRLPPVGGSPPKTPATPAAKK